MLLTVEEGKLLELLKLHSGRLCVRVMCTSVPHEACQRKGIRARTVHGVLIQTPCSIASVVLQCTQTPHPIVTILLEILLGTVLFKREMEEAREFVPRPPVLFVRKQKILTQIMPFPSCFLPGYVSKPNNVRKEQKCIYEKVL